MTVTRTGFDPADPELWADPYPTFARLRAHEPCHRAAGGYWVVTRHADVVRLLKDRDLSSAQPPGAPGSPVEALAAHERSVMVASDPPEHARRRGALAGRFAPAAIDALREPVRARVDALLDTLDPSAPVDVVEALASPLAAGTLAEALGLPDQDVPRLRRWAAGVVGGLEPWAGADAEAVSAEALAEFSGYMADAVDSRRSAPGGDLLSLLAGHPDLDRDEAIHNAVLLVNAGLDTTADLVAGAVATLLATPDQWRALCDDPDGRSPAVAEEAVRHLSPVQFAMRRTVAPVVVAGTTIPAAEGVLLALASANHDPDAFADPEAFDPDRAGPRSLGFGAGAHLCLGAPLARLEAAAAVAALAERFPRAMLVGPVPWRPMVFFRGPASVPVQLAALPSAT